MPSCAGSRSWPRPWRSSGWRGRVSASHGRAEELAREPDLRATFDAVTARSFGPPAVTAECGAPFLTAGGVLRGRRTARGRSRAVARRRPRPARARATGASCGPGAARCGDCGGGLAPDRFPRRAGIPANGRCSRPTRCSPWNIAWCRLRRGLPCSTWNICLLFASEWGRIPPVSELTPEAIARGRAIFERLRGGTATERARPTPTRPATRARDDRTEGRLPRARPGRADRTRGPIRSSSTTRIPTRTRRAWIEQSERARSTPSRCRQLEAAPDPDPEPAPVPSSVGDETPDAPEVPAPEPPPSPLRPPVAPDPGGRQPEGRRGQDDDDGEPGGLPRRPRVPGPRRRPRSPGQRLHGPRDQHPGPQPPRCTTSSSTTRPSRTASSRRRSGTCSWRPPNLDLAGAEIELVPAFSRELKLRARARQRCGTTTTTSSSTAHRRSAC